jgi:hypothetical protein
MPRGLDAERADLEAEYQALLRESDQLNEAHAMHKARLHAHLERARAYAERLRQSSIRKPDSSTPVDLEAVDRAFSEVPANRGPEQFANLWMEREKKKP